VIAGVFGATNFWVVLIGVGLIGGSGIGLGYVVPIAVGMRWFPDKKGMITGLAVAGFGFGALGWVKLAGAWGHLIDNVGLAQTFVIYGVAFAALIWIGASGCACRRRAGRPRASPRSRPRPRAARTTPSRRCCGRRNST
jgi:OFA family oxalate/formate antiporter-like MFS transporter